MAKILIGIVVTLAVIDGIVYFYKPVTPTKVFTTIPPSIEELLKYHDSYGRNR